MTHCQQSKGDQEKVTVHHLYHKEISDDGPPQHLISKFKTLQGWLRAICETDKPKKSIAEYRFSVSESSYDCILSLMGVNKYSKGKNLCSTRIEFEPSNKQFKLPKSEYGNLNREHLLDRLTSQLRDFVNTEAFRTSFLSETNTIVFESSGQTIWSK